ncbi:hypothetical protein OG897_16300 [Streptomyces sp. NBC_00237]|uniref:VG15 protein n=1 Tax=Streptomyces sp. NBC_00237 TaxID=2975687 RepID=UPI00224F3171|nr:hypothetical protein [Streptomyces sp. NBC_00237]MCX5203003.1 hypothetical protein [Streptomyces sp. NBC_00237]
MATLEGAALIREFKRSQTRIGQEVAKSWQGIPRKDKHMVAAARRTAAKSSLKFVDDFSRLETGNTLTLDTVDELEQMLNAIVQDNIEDDVRSLGQSVKTALDGGREMTAAAIDRDRRVKAWQRVASPNACGFCALLASRGAVYKSRKSGSQLTSRSRSVRFGDAGVGASFHPSCRCVIVPSYSNDAYVDDMARDWLIMWKQSGGSLAKFRKMIAEERGTKVH